MKRRLLLLASITLLSSAVVAQAARFTVDSIGTEADPVRVMKGAKDALKNGIILSQLNNEGGVGLPVYTAGSGAKAFAVDAASGKTKTFFTVTFTTKDKYTFGDDPKSVAIDLITGMVGKSSGTVNIATDVAKGKPALLKPPKGGVNTEALLTYSINSLEQRKMKVAKVKFGDMLKGAIIDTSLASSPKFMVATGNKGEYAESLADAWVAKAGDYQLVDVKTGIGGLTVETKLVNTATAHINSKGKLAVDNTPLRIYGTTGFSDYAEKVKIQDKLVPVETGEAESVGDTKPYKPLTISYEATTVGLAKKIQKSPGKKGDGIWWGINGKPMTDFGQPGKVSLLKAQIAAGHEIAQFSTTPGQSFSLASKIPEKGTLKAETTANPTQVTYVEDPKKPGVYKIATKTNLKNLYKVVGSEAEILAGYYASGTGAAADSEINMQWRARTQEEAHNLLKDKSVGYLPTDRSPAWLTSDVVKIGGSAVTNDLYYALQISFDNRINLSFDGPVNGLLDNEWDTMWIGQLDSTGTKWEAAVDLSDPSKAHYSSDEANSATLEQFLESALTGGATLESLVGNWGVDKASSKSWAIVKGGGSGIFAVVPEPATVLMLISATLGAVTYGWRRFSRRGRVVA